MDTIGKYVADAEFYVRMAGETEPEWVQSYWDDRIADADSNVVGFGDEPLRNHHQSNPDVPISGIICFYFPEGLDEDSEVNPWSFTFPFRDHRQETAPWAAFPEKSKLRQQPVWKWTNPSADPHARLTLEPSIGVGDPMQFHCWVQNGEVTWL